MKKIKSFFLKFGHIIAVPFKKLSVAISKHKTPVKVSAFVVILFITAYLTFMAFQGLNTSIVGYFDQILPYFGSIVNIFLLPAFAVFLYRLFFSPQKTRIFHLKNGYFLAIVALIGMAGCIYSACIYTNWWYGITWFYPIDFLVVDFIILILGVFTIVKGYRIEKPAEKQKIHISHGFIIALMYVYIFIALDRSGALIMSLINAPNNGTSILLTIYCSLISPMVLALGFVMNKVKAPKEHIPSKSFCICAFTSLGLALIGFIVGAVYVFGPNASDYMRIASPFFALDRLAAKPILIVLLTTLSVAIPLAFAIHIVRYFLTHKKPKEAAEEPK